MGDLRAISKLEFKDEDEYRIDFMHPVQTKWNRQQIHRSGDRKRRWLGDPKEWKDLGTEPATKSMTAAEVERWMWEFPYEVHSIHATGRDAWSPIVKAWAEGVAGFQVEIEKANYVIDGSTMPYYKLVVTRENEPNTRAEILINGYFNLPVRINVDATEDDGQVSIFRWSTNWQFQRDFEPGHFDIE